MIDSEHQRHLVNTFFARLKDCIDRCSNLVSFDQRPIITNIVLETQISLNQSIESWLAENIDLIEDPNSIFQPLNHAPDFSHLSIAKKTLATNIPRIHSSRSCSPPLYESSESTTESNHNQTGVSIGVGTRENVSTMTRFSMQPTILSRQKRRMKRNKLHKIKTSANDVPQADTILNSSSHLPSDSYKKVKERRTTAVQYRDDSDERQPFDFHRSSFSSFIDLTSDEIATGVTNATQTGSAPQASTSNKETGTVEAEFDDDFIFCPDSDIENISSSSIHTTLSHLDFAVQTTQELTRPHTPVTQINVLPQPPVHPFTFTRTNPPPPHTIFFGFVLGRQEEQRHHCWIACKSFADNVYADLGIYKETACNKLKTGQAVKFSVIPNALSSAAFKTDFLEILEDSTLHTNITNKTSGICRFFTTHGWCKHGDKCRFAHLP
ncbi:hypothetical protein BLNAU_12660 [Blattamonas nauphoetae]|uniref:C3H1-type domain-containing protein n=1 Tax=Blattamonas nauphoetae TaxID=2049346 RepID=A0ABQ9XM60_9EUKA|nr:hypothetical protein BLNAU_12660 [Blattamonas nauphoetae]